MVKMQQTTNNKHIYSEWMIDVYMELYIFDLVNIISQKQGIFQRVSHNELLWKAKVHSGNDSI